MTMAFKILAQKYPIKAFFGPKFPFFFFCEILQVDKFEGVDFEYNNSFLKFYPKNTQIRHFWSQFCISTNLRVLISNMTIAFCNSSTKILKSGIFDPKFRHFCFFVTFCNLGNSGLLISNMTTFF